MSIALAGFFIRRGVNVVYTPNRYLRCLCFLSPSVPWPRRSLGVQLDSSDCRESDRSKNSSPWLMLSSSTCRDARFLCELNMTIPHDDVDEFKRQTAGKLKVTVKKEIQLPEFARDHCCIGSSHGFVFSVPTSCSPNVVAFNPFTAERLPLPPTCDLPDIDERKPWSANDDIDPLQLDLVKPGTTEKVTVDFNFDSFFQAKALLSPSIGLAVLLRRRRLQSYADIHFTQLPSSSSSRWLPLPLPLTYVQDCIFHQGHLIFVDDAGTFATYKDTGDALNPNFFIKPSDLEVHRDGFLRHKYLVESPSGEDLFFVCRGLPPSRDASFTYGKKRPERRTHHFVVFRLDKNGGYRWKRVYSLQGLAFFVGPAGSVSVCAADCPGVVPDCIYFADDLPLLSYLTSNGIERLGDSGVYDLQEEVIRFLSLPVGDGKCQLNWPPPSWIVPTVSSYHQARSQTGAKKVVK